MTDSTLPADLEDAVREAMFLGDQYTGAALRRADALAYENDEEFQRLDEHRDGCRAALESAIRTLAVRCAAAEARNTTMIKAPRPNENWLPELARAYDQMQEVEVKAKSEASVQEAREAVEEVVVGMVVRAERNEAKGLGADAVVLTNKIDALIAAVRAEGEGKESK